jgi:hypothetical protein
MGMKLGHYLQNVVLRDEYWLQVFENWVLGGILDSRGTKEKGSEKTA